MDKITKVRIRISTVKKAVEFCNILSRFNSSCQLRNVTDEAHKFIIDAKSIMGIFSLNLLDDFYLYIYDYNEESSSILREINNFIISPIERS